MALELEKLHPAARSLRLQRVRETSISPTALLEKSRGTYEPRAIDDLCKVAKRQCVAKKVHEKLVAMKCENALCPKPEEEEVQKMIEIARHGSISRGWNGTYIFDAIEQMLPGESTLEWTILRSKHAAWTEHALARRALDPDTAFYLSRMPENTCLELKALLFERISTIIGTARVSCQQFQTQLDRRRVFHPDINAERAQARYVASLQRKLNLGAIEDECLIKMIHDLEASNSQDDEKRGGLSASARNRARTVLLGIKLGAGLSLATAKSLKRKNKLKKNKEKPTLPSLDFGRLNAPMAQLSDDELLRRFERWRNKREKFQSDLMLKQTESTQLPATPLVMDTLRNIVQPPRMRPPIQSDISDATLDALCPRYLRRERHQVQPFENKFLLRAATSKTPSSSSSQVEHAPKSNTTVESSQDEEEKGDTPQEKAASSSVHASSLNYDNESQLYLTVDDDVSSAVTSGTTATPASHRASFSFFGKLRSASSRMLANETEDTSKKLAQIFRDLKVSTQAKLTFLQKYATVEQALILPQAIELWASAADLFKRRIKVLELQERLESGEQFESTQFRILLRNASKLPLVMLAVQEDDVLSFPAEKNDAHDEEHADEYFSTTYGDEESTQKITAEQASIARVIAQFDTELDTLAKRAMTTLGDRLPKLNLSLDEFRDKDRII